VKSRQKALLIADLAKGKLGEDIVILDMRKLSSITDFFVITSASSTKRCQAIAENLETGLSEKGETNYKTEGYRDGLWVIVDAYDVVAHIFYSDVRKFYNLESLWGDAPRIKICQKKKKTRLRKTSKRK